MTHNPTQSPPLCSAIYNTSSQTYRTLLVCGGTVVHAEFSPDSSEFLVSGRDDRIHVYDAQSGEINCSLEGHTSDVLFARQSPINRWVQACCSGADLSPKNRQMG